MVEYVEGSVCDTIKSTSKKKNSKLLKLFSEDFSIPIVEEKVKKAKKEKDEETKKEELIEIKRLSVEELINQNKRTIFIGNLSKEVEKKSIKNLFSPFGAIESVRLRSAAPNNPKLPKKAIVIKKMFNEKSNTVNAYVVFKDSASVGKAFELNGTEFQGFHIRVDCDIENKEHDHKKSVFVGNLAFDEKEEKVRKLFAVCGDIDNVRLIRDKNTCMGKGFGYVLFKEVSSVSLALKLHNKKIGNREIRVMASTSKPKTLSASKRPLDQLKSQGEIKKKKFMGDINIKEFKQSREKTRENRKKYKRVKTSFGKTKSKRIKKKSSSTKKKES